MSIAQSFSEKSLSLSILAVNKVPQSTWADLRTVSRAGRQGVLKEEWP